MKTCSFLLFLSAVSCVALVGSLAAARGDDWPQWMGPARDGVWRETGIVEAIQG